jgi:hypothetical protein
LLPQNGEEDARPIVRLGGPVEEDRTEARKRASEKAVGDGSRRSRSGSSSDDNSDDSDKAEGVC